ncbi:hypothetical protein NP493_732g02028 [Ridgeia piscesae]|uniref:Uncharacterized protein n=1 Tax=Ridgeia piscesae TaxID=27915 RepID=A0AAD9KPZ2_RIDPI|nr:hypothetical protein NP493_732g02028 [Ridgeia piscesae]
MFDYKRRSSEVEQADREPRREKNNRKLAVVAMLVDAATIAEPTTDITLPRLPSAALRSPVDLTLPRKLPSAVPQSTTDITLPKIPSAAPRSPTDDVVRTHTHLTVSSHI